MGCVGGSSTSVARIELAKRRPSEAEVPAREPGPFVKWVGGKGRIMPQLLPLLPPGAERMRHVEPFVGGGALFFARRPARALLCDVNEALVEAYEVVRDEVESVVEPLTRLAERHSQERYYQVRERYNRGRRISRAERVAMFLYLNKTCFNGLHRVNRQGNFNVPAGRYKNPRILDAELLRAASEMLGGAEIRQADFHDQIELARPGDFVYLDPPYAPVSATANFTSYAQDGFGPEAQEQLRDVFHALDRRGCKLMLSNSDVPYIHELYGRWRIDRVAAPRAVNCDARNRGRVTEVVIRNY